MANPILSGRDYLALPRSRQTFLIDPLLPVGGSMTIYGEPKTGKSFLGLQMALDLVEGTSWLGFRTTQPCVVAYIQLDTPGSLWSARLKDLRGTGLDVEKIHFADRETLGCWPFDIMNPDHFAILSDSLLEIKPDVVFIDTLKEAHQLDENNNTEGQKVIANLTAATQPAALILIHHSRKQSELPDDITQGARGASYLTGKMDAIVQVTKKQIKYVGRAIEEGVIKIDRLDNGLWVPAQAEADRLIEAIMQEGGSVREMGRKLSDQLHRSEESCRSLIRRHIKRGRLVGESDPPRDPELTVSF